MNSSSENSLTCGCLGLSSNRKQTASAAPMVRHYKLTGYPESLLAGTWRSGWIQALPHAWRSSAEAMLWATKGDKHTHTDIYTQTHPISTV